VTTRSFGSVALRIVGIVLFVQALVALSAPVNSLDLAMRLGQLDLASAKAEFLVSGVLPVALLLVFAIAFIFGSDVIARRWFQADEAVGTAGAVNIEALAFAAAGLIVFGFSIPGLARCAAQMVSPLNSIGEEPGHVDFSWRDALGPGLQAAFGLVLFVGARKIGTRWRRQPSHDA
jgi:hypothetical protein